MLAERARLRRLHRLERVRAIARQAAAQETAEAENAYNRLATLAERTRRIATELSPAAALACGQELIMHQHFSARLHDLEIDTSSNAERARSTADLKQVELAAAERRRVAVADRAEQAGREFALRQATPPLGARRAVGTGLE